MILATIRMTLAAHDRSGILEILNTEVERVRVKSGCLSSRFYHDIQQEEIFMIEEVWETQEDLDCHLRSDEYRDLLLAAEMSKEPPEIHFRTVSHTAGLELIEKARGF